MASIKNSLIIGMGIGQLYKGVLEELGARVITVDTDPEKNATYKSVQDAISNEVVFYQNCEKPFETVHICTPNWTHESIAYDIAPYAKIVFIEKPGLISEERLNKLHLAFPNTRFMMVKNNMWRDNIKEMQQAAYASRAIYFNWLNFDRVPNPGTWFTTKDLAFGGVSRDLMPHLLSLVVALFPETYKELDLTGNGKDREWSLYDLVKTEYGTVNPNGTYNVDDSAWLNFNMYRHDGVPERFINLEADWRTLAEDERNIVFDTGEEEIKFELGLCPEYAYKNMIQDCFDNLNVPVFWVIQYEIDLWIHRMVNEI